jgi:endonuclease/exonuclease/phosphatase family metal-dependent hydrolase
MRRAGAAALLGLAIAGAAAGCRAVLNYQSPLGPRYAGQPAARAASETSGTGRALRVVTYNVQWGEHVDRAIHVLTTRAPLPEADIVVLQEMDAEGTRRIADTLGMAWVYYPAAVHPKRGRDFGNAILSRWPIVAAVFNWDHIFLKGFTSPERAATGIVRDTLRTSDHDPVWAVAQLP